MKEKDKKMYCDLCDKDVEKSVKYPDGVWACDPCNAKHPMQTEETVIYYHDTGDENDNKNEHNS